MKRMVVWAVGMCLVAGVARAEGLAIGGKIGTLGIGADVTIEINQDVSLRGSLSYLKWNYDRTIEDIDYDLEIDYQSVLAVIDWFIFGTDFRISGGVIFQDNTVTLDATPAEPVRIGGATYPEDVVGTLTGTSTFDDLAPYIGIGYGRAVGPDKQFSLILDLGVVIQSYEVDLTATGPAAAFAPFVVDLEAEEQKIEDDLSNFEIYPVLAIGLAYQF